MVASKRMVSLRCERIELVEVDGETWSTQDMMISEMIRKMDRGQSLFLF